MVIRKALVALAVMACCALGPPAMASPADDLGLSNTMIQTPSTNDSTDVLQVESIALNGRSPLAPLEVGAAASTG